MTTDVWGKERTSRADVRWHLRSPIPRQSGTLLFGSPPVTLGTVIYGREMILRGCKTTGRCRSGCCQMAASGLALYKLVFAEAAGCVSKAVFQLKVDECLTWDSDLEGKMLQEN